ncbi:YibE/F family protein [Anaerovorax odorimutans]|uniref:YibE/F family protein n=1 Tax=Anaerovorax odorimutans TaxID=109327 RepID=UPI000425B3F5|nr:YibE/F family protein [Anaerovorax odorimutans]
MKTKRNKSYLVYILTIILSIILIYTGNQYTMGTAKFFDNENNTPSVKAKVIKVIDKQKNVIDYGESTKLEETTVLFSCKILSGENKNKVVEASQSIDSTIYHNLKEVKLNDKVIICNMPNQTSDTSWVLIEYVRSDILIWLGISFFILLLLFGRFKGFNTIVSLTFTCLAVFFVFIPSILTGRNIYYWSIITCVFTILMTLLVIYGANKKSLAAGLGCFGGIIVSGLLTQIMSKILSLTGFVSEESYYLTMMATNNPIDLKAIIFASIIIGALGAIMDVSISISSSLYEIYEQSEKQTIKSIIKSGIRIGQDIMGTMSNTLILAYIGSSLSMVLLLLTYNNSFIELLNRELIVVEILQALVGSIGILFTIPLTSIICGILYNKNKYKHSTEEETNVSLNNINNL